MTELSPAARAVLTAVTQRQYSLDPEDVPNEAVRIAYEASIVLRTVAEQILPRDTDPSGDWSDKDETRSQLFSIATELEGAGVAGAIAPT
jgi:hypothetical protein